MTAVTQPTAECVYLRDQVSTFTGLTRQEIARAIGVDRRSLSGFVTGEIRPTKRRLLALRVLADTAKWSFEQYGEHAREVLRGSDADPSPLTLIADGRTDIRPELRAIAHRAGLTNEKSITIQRRAAKEPLYVRAATHWTGSNQLPTRQGTPRDDTEYEQDLSKAVAAVALPDKPRRRCLTPRGGLRASLRLGSWRGVRGWRGVCRRCRRGRRGRFGGPILGRQSKAPCWRSVPP